MRTLHTALVLTALAVSGLAFAQQQGQSTTIPPAGPGRNAPPPPVDGGGDLPVPGPQIMPTPAPDSASATDLVLLLDTSNSMDGLINQAKSQLWSVVRQYADAQRDGEPAKLRVALFEYGNTRLPATENYIRQVVPLTDNLDALSEALFSLTTNGGDEYCGAVIGEALTRLDWASHDGAYRTIFIAGNEPFTQGPIDYRSACGEARGRGVVINTIHCGDSEEGRQGSWADGAAVGGGQAFNIDQDRVMPTIPCPQDPRLLELSVEINGTYLWYGDDDERNYNYSNQMAQDENAGEMGEAAAADRASVKGGSAYSNVGRDLVDTFGATPEKVADIEAEKLPEAMRKMSPEERVEHVKQMAAERAKLREQIGKLSAERAEFLVSKQAELAEGDPTLGDALAKAVRDQLTAAGFEVKSPSTRPGE